MGLAKAMWLEAQERGFSVDTDVVVCTNCFDDYGIKQFIAQHDTGEACSYCSHTGDASCSLEQTMEHLLSCIKSEWGHSADEGLRVAPVSHDPYQHDEMNPIEILDSLGEIVEELDLLDVIEPTASIKRVRIVELSDTLVSAKELGSPPHQYATIPNRMSPAGIPMFYGAYNIETAIAETYDSPFDSGTKAVCGHFVPLKELAVLDLSKDICVPSLFEGGAHKRRRLTKFLLGFLALRRRGIYPEDWGGENVPSLRQGSNASDAGPFVPRILLVLPALRPGASGARRKP